MKRVHFCAAPRLWVLCACCHILLLVCALGTSKGAPMMRLALQLVAGQARQHGRLADAAELLVVMRGYLLWRKPQRARMSARLLCDHHAC